MYLIDFDTPAQWGERVSASKNGLVEKYELDFGDGNKVTTFVIWAEGEDRPTDRNRDVNER
jgi:hypothetical protein